MGEVVVAVLFVYGIEAVEEDEGEVWDGGFISLPWKDGRGGEGGDKGPGASEVQTSRKCTRTRRRVDRWAGTGAVVVGSFVS